MPDSFNDELARFRTSNVSAEEDDSLAKAVSESFTLSAVRGALKGAAAVLISRLGADGSEEELRKHSLFKPLYDYLEENAPKDQTTRNSADTEDAKAQASAAMAHRSNAIQSAVAQIQRDSNLSYNDAWNRAQTLPELKPLFDSMQNPTRKQ